MNEVKIVGVTMPVGMDGISTPEELIAYAARVSNPSNQSNTKTASKLLKYCATNKHWSVFEVVNVVFSITTTRDIARQILRHRSFSFQEFSQRYANPLGFAEPREARLQDKANRQNSISTKDETLQTEWNDKQRELVKASEDTYNWAIEHGIAKEQARVVLPEGLTISRLYMNGTLRSWIHYVQLRSKEGTQKEHRELALMIEQEILKMFPSLNGILDGQ
jgi:thymidylate synthase (FAD)